jgi:SSS family solute:Na+ symporter
MFVDTPVTMKLGSLADGYTPGSFLWIINNINFQYFSILIVLVSAVVMVVVSHATAVPDPEQIKNLTFGTTTAENKAKTYASWSWQEVAASGLVLLCILGAYLYFTG